MQIEEYQEFSKYLQPNESIQWVGHPQGGILFRSSDLFLIPFSLLWGGFSFFWEYSAYTSGAPVFFLLFGSFFVIMGLYITVGRFFVDMLIREDTMYGLTNERILILSGLFSKSLKSLSIKSLPEISLSEKSNGRGTITFGSSGGMQEMFMNTSWPGSNRASAPSFEMIEDARNIFQKIQSLKRL